MSNKKSAAKKKALNKGVIPWPETSGDSPKIHILANFRIKLLSNPDHPENNENFQLNLPTSYGRQASIKFSYPAGIGKILLRDVPIQAEALNFIRTPGDPFSNFISYADVFEPTFQSTIQELNTLVQRVIEYVKFFLGRHEIAGEVIDNIQTFFWSESLSSSEFHGLPGKVSANLKFNVPHKVDNAAIVDLQRGLDNGILPFVAMRHIYRAIQENNPAFKWIDATIAAELAIKEALIRKEPKIAAFIEHVPSPPLSKLYGELMEVYLGKRSDFCGVISNGAALRNKLVHQPLEQSVTRSEAEDYVSQVLIAINELYGLLYPDWKTGRDAIKIRHLGTVIGQA
ncbi:hypothetical protein [Massilia timonae]|uniref:hypothetical protein n=1 Tax=Massilia timonae TaxID=47229 RepID=UPI0028985124|nr:hypothetical protein [Massilia timonae]